MIPFGNYRDGCSFFARILLWVLAITLLFCSIRSVGSPAMAARQGSAADAIPAGQIQRSETEEEIKQAFIRSDPDYVATRTSYQGRLVRLTARLIALQENGRNMACANQILVESRWLLEHTTHWVRLDRKLSELSERLGDRQQAFALSQSPADGAWGACYDEWFLKLDATIDALNQLADERKTPHYPLKFFARIEEPKDLRAYLDSLIVSNIAKTGTDHRDELGAVTGAVSQMLFKAPLRHLISKSSTSIELSRQYVEDYRDFLDSWQEPDTGYWGAWYRFGPDLVRSKDLSLTFHAISYRKGKANHWPQIIDTTLAIRPYEYPYGWMHNGEYTHHNNYDVIKIFRYGWPHMSPQQKARVRSEIEAMLEWCLRMPMRGASLFAIDPTFYSNISNYYYYGVSFLDEIGYLNKSRRFWTDRDFPEAADLCRKIKARLISLDLNTPTAAAALTKLQADCPSR